MLGHGGSSAGSYLADPTSPIPSHCAVIILFQSVAVHQLSWLALQELNKWNSFVQTWSSFLPACKYNSFAVAIVVNFTTLIPKLSVYQTQNYN